ncbi:hypothetical protein [Vibrio marisflavi]|nr:hypothetical protein [Vibrio marisflavi]
MSKANKAAETIGQINKLVDDNFTSDEEKKKHAALMEKLAINSNNKFVQGGRSALMWSLGAVVVYQCIVRDILAITLHVELPPLDFDAGTLLTHVTNLLAGSI